LKHTLNLKKIAALPKLGFLLLLFILFDTIICSCNSSNRQTSVNKAFYYWQNHLSSNDLDTSDMTRRGVKRLYVRLMDIDLNAQGQAIPMSKANINWSVIPLSVEVVPVCYIRNSVFQSKNLNNALFVSQLSAYIKNEANIGKRIFQEIQFDCDWSASTKTAYFKFLSDIKKALFQNNKQPILSATIRLHQLKYRSKTGIPPVDRGALMLYNMEDVTKPNTRNSIFDPSILEKYLSKQNHYELPLDIALPLFSWGVLFRQNRFEGLVNGLNTEGVSQLRFLKKLNNNHFEVQQDTVWGSNYLRLGDVIRLEEISETDLMSCANQARQVINSDTTSIIFYHYDKKILNRYDNKSLETIYNRFR
jgi:hypothetical protein